MTEDTLTLNLAAGINQSHVDVAAIRDQIARWQQLFSPAEDTYSLDGFEDLYEQTPDALLVYDNFAELETRWTGFDTYRRTWEEQINNNFPGFVMFRIDVDRIEVSDNLAWSGLTWWGSVVIDGEEQIVAQHGTHVWRRNGDVWQISHEHLTSGVKESGEPSVRNRADTPRNGAYLHRRAVASHRP